MELIPQNRIVSKIIILRGQNVILDRDILEFYAEPIEFRDLIDKNIERFPEDFMLKLVEEETKLLISKNVIPSEENLEEQLPYAFTEQGVAMLSSVLPSENLIHINIQIIKTFLRLRQYQVTYKELKSKIEAMMKIYDQKFETVFLYIDRFFKPKLPGTPLPRNRIGFRRD